MNQTANELQSYHRQKAEAILRALGDADEENIADRVAAAMRNSVSQIYNIDIAPHVDLPMEARMLALGARTNTYRLVLQRHEDEWGATIRGTVEDLVSQGWFGQKEEWQAKRLAQTVIKAELEKEDASDETAIERAIRNAVTFDEYLHFFADQMFLPNRNPSPILARYYQRHHFLTASNFDRLRSGQPIDVSPRGSLYAKLTNLGELAATHFLYQHTHTGIADQLFGRARVK